ncbi:hypothetical protein [Vulcanococcus sp.]|jgi:hypothetical protein|uniref:hypothetical protein n=1 Tax=Vulcanococcus sp. TaxID=2856995 RepID=UPI0037D9D295
MFAQRALLLSAAALLSPAAFAEPSSPQPVLLDCAGKGLSRPRAIQISCADGGILVSDIRWSRWDMNGAKGTGNLVVNSCIYKGGPSCVEGQTMSYPATLSLGRPASGEGITALTELRLRFTDQGPAGLSSGSYRIDNPRRP